MVQREIRTVPVFTAFSLRNALFKATTGIGTANAVVTQYKIAFFRHFKDTAGFAGFGVSRVSFVQIGFIYFKSFGMFSVVDDDFIVFQFYGFSGKTNNALDKKLLVIVWGWKTITSPRWGSPTCHPIKF